MIKNHFKKMRQAVIKKQVFLLIAIIFLGLILRINKWMFYSLWYDEVCFLLASKNISLLKEASAFFLKPQLFALFLFIWQKISTNEFFLRIPSLIAGVLSIITTYIIGKWFVDKKTGLIAGAITAIIPLHIYYAQEIGYYTITVLTASLSMIFFWMSIKKDEWRFWIPYILVTLIGIFINYLCLLILYVQFVFILIVFCKKKIIISKALLAQAIVFIIFLPFAKYFLVSSLLLMNSSMQFYHWFPAGNMQYIFQTFNVFNLGYHASKQMYYFGAGVFSVLFLDGIWVLRKEFNKLLLLLLWLFLPLIAILIMGHIFFIPMYTHRNLIFSSVPYYIIIASAIGKLPQRYARCVLLIAIFSISVSLYNLYFNILHTSEFPYRPGIHTKKDHRSTVEYVMQYYKDGDMIRHVCYNTFLPFAYYLTYKKHVLNRNTYSVLLTDEQQLDNLGEKCNRLWLIYSSWEMQRDKSIEVIKQKCDERFFLLNVRRFEGIDVYLYDISLSSNGNRR
ncbi:MAG: glycosyltransferase family 39 protein [Candidatus Omnitrophota bacterium]